MKITITGDDIKNGVQRNWNRCPIALALKRIGFNVRVGNTTIVEHTQNSRVSISHTTTPEAQKFIEAFDDNELVQPVELEVWKDAEMH